MGKQITLTSLIIVFFLCVMSYARAEGVLSWQDCVKESAKNHPDLISAQESIKQSEASKKISASTLFPQIGSSVSGSTSAATTRVEGTKTGKASDAYAYGVSGSQLLFDGLKTLNKVNAASENIKAARYNYKFTSTEVRLRLRTAFIDVLKSQELLKITQDIFDIRRGNLELITLRYESGIEHKGALLTAEANLAQAEFEITQNKRAFEVAQRELTKGMGRTQFAPIKIEGSFQVKDAALEKPDFEALAKASPSLGRLIAQKNAASFGIKAAQANFLPELSAQAGAGKNSSLWPPRNNQWDAGLTVSFPIFEGGLRLAEVAQAKSIYNQAQADERSIKDSVLVALEQTWAALQDAIATVEVQKKFLDATEERAKIAEAQYSLGLIQFDNWIIIENDLVGAKKSFLNAQANALVAEANWIQAKGETLEYAS